MVAFICLSLSVNSLQTYVGLFVGRALATADQMKTLGIGGTKRSRDELADESGCTRVNRYLINRKFVRDRAVIAYSSSCRSAKTQGW